MLQVIPAPSNSVQMWMPRAHGNEMACFLFGLVENLHSDSHRKKNGKNVWDLHTRHAIFIVRALWKGESVLLCGRQQRLRSEGLRLYRSVGTRERPSVLHVSCSQSWLSGLGATYSQLGAMSVLCPQPCCGDFRKGKNYFEIMGPL